MTDYLINGLEEPALIYTRMGNGHFMYNMTPNLYQLIEIVLSGREVRMHFKPTENVPKQLRDECKEYLVSVQPHPNFKLIVKEAASSTVRYLLLDCRKDEAGKTYFHYDILQNAEVGEELTKSIYRGTTMDYLIGKKYTPIESGGNDGTLVFSTIYKAS